MSFDDLKIEVLNDEKTAEVLKYYPNYTRGLIAIGEKRWCLPYMYNDIGKELYEFEPCPDDTWIVTHPRSGTTLTQELIWLVANDLDFDGALNKPLVHRFPFVDISTIMEAKLKENLPDSEIHVKNSINFTREQPSSRFIKSHMPFDLLPKVVNSDCKIIYVARNPKDVVVSWYYFQKEIDLIKYTGNFEQFCDFFMNDRLIYSPYWEHVKEAWANRHRPNTLFIFYENLMKDLPGIIRKIAAFYGKNYNDEQIAKLVNHLNINKFRKNKMVNAPTGDINMRNDMFIRQGTVGGWKEHFTQEMEAKFNKWIADNTKETDLAFP